MLRFGPGMRVRAPAALGAAGLARARSVEHSKVAENRNAQAAPDAPRVPAHRKERAVSFQAICGASRGVVGSKRATHLQLCCRALKGLHQPGSMLRQAPVAESRAERSRTRWMRAARPLT